MRHVQGMLDETDPLTWLIQDASYKPKEVGFILRSISDIVHCIKVIYRASEEGPEDSSQHRFQIFKKLGLKFDDLSP